MADRAIFWLWHGVFALTIIAGLISSERHLIESGVCALLGFWLGRTLR